MAEFWYWTWSFRFLLDVSVTLKTNQLLYEWSPQKNPGLQSEVQSASLQWLVGGTLL